MKHRCTGLGITLAICAAGFAQTPDTVRDGPNGTRVVVAGEEDARALHDRWRFAPALAAGEYLFLSGIIAGPAPDDGTDVVWIHDREAALAGARSYIGDGATIHRNMVRRHEASGELIGHCTIIRQLTWCAREGVPKMIVTHCGSDIVGGDERSIGAELRRLARIRGVEVEIAHDGMERILR